MPVVKLSVHKNNKKQRERKELRKRAIVELKDCLKQENLSGYSIVAWDEDKQSITAWGMLGDSPVEASDIPRFFKRRLNRSLAQRDIDDSK